MKASALCVVGLALVLALVTFPFVLVDWWPLGRGRGGVAADAEVGPPGGNARTGRWG
jgi:hypothetical protein